MNAGGACIGCTMPGFPDKFTPFYKVAPGSHLSSTITKIFGRRVHDLRIYTNEHLNREVRWDVHKETPTAWAREKPEPGPVREAGHKIYDALRRNGDRGKSDAREWGKRDPEWTEQEDPELEPSLPRGVPPGEASAPAPEPEHDEGLRG
jgi:hydrogenase small subunit